MTDPKPQKYFYSDRVPHGGRRPRRRHPSRCNVPAVRNQLCHYNESQFLQKCVQTGRRARRMRSAARTGKRAANGYPHKADRRGPEDGPMRRDRRLKHIAPERRGLRVRRKRRPANRRSGRKPGDSLTLSLLMALVLGADDHYFAVSFDNFALVAHGLY